MGWQGTGEGHRNGQKNGKKLGFWRGVGEERELEGGWMGKSEMGPEPIPYQLFQCSDISKELSLNNFRT